MPMEKSIENLMGKIKIIAFSDTHGSFKVLRKIKKKIQNEKRKRSSIDLAVCGGDFTIFEQHMQKLLFLINSLGIKVLLVPGNHESPAKLRILSHRFKNIIFIHKAMCRFGDYVFLGYGGGGFALQDREFLRWAGQQMKKLRKEDKVILVLHGPPYGTVLDKVIGDHCGNKDYTKFIKEHHRKIKLVLAGHIHECFNSVSKIKSTVIASPGPYGMIFEMGKRK